VTEEQPGVGPTVHRMLLGAQLRRLRTDAGLTREQAGEAIRASEWKIHRLENGQVGYKERDIVDLLRLYGVTDHDEIDFFITLAQEANQPGWWNTYSDLLPQWFRAYIDLESAATLIRTYEGQLVPGLLQTEDYMRTLMQGAFHEPPTDTERRIAMRLTRQRLLTRPDGPRLWAVVDEAALRRSVGGREVMRAQVARLLEATELPSVVLQVLPLAVGAHPAMATAFTILRFPDEALPDVVYLEHLTDAAYLDRRESVDHYYHVMELISARSAAPEETPEILDKILEEW
jgi:transcriptional regulator with XRE-family HTH domain